VGKDNSAISQNKIAVISGGSRGIGQRRYESCSARSRCHFYLPFKPERGRALVRDIEEIGRRAAGLQLDTGNLRSFDEFVANVRRTLESWSRDRFDSW